MTNDTHDDPRASERTAGQPNDSLGRALQTIARTVLVAVALSFGAGVGTAQADSRGDYLIGLLQSSGQFRVRVQAALALSRAPVSDDSATDALVRALRDEHPAVRAAAASALQTRGDVRVLYALRIAATVRDPGVASAAARAVSALERTARATATFHGLRSL